MKVCFVSAPLMARSGVYRSTYDLVAAGRKAGLDWTGLIGMRRTAQGAQPSGSTGVREVTVETHGSHVIGEIRHILESSPEVQGADVVVTLITQSDIAFAKSKLRNDKTWVAFTRGLPWPDVGEQTALRRVVMKQMEVRALRSADEVWATTSILRDQLKPLKDVQLIPAGIPHAGRVSYGANEVERLVWAGRFDADKRPLLFLDLCQKRSVAGVLYGSGPLEQEIRSALPAGVSIGGWVSPSELWNEAEIFIGTSRREAFGRSAAEAALAGVPVIISDQYGVAGELFTDEALAKICVISGDDPNSWARAIQRLQEDIDLRREVSDHVHLNASRLTIESSAQSVDDRLISLAAKKREK